ncbi:MAG TPA: hypothetical protein PLX89_17800 [Verrucomicrobiota bacterium]|nr:hypothetical protein [Verrucomicrobiota bacterium]
MSLLRALIWANGDEPSVPGLIACYPLSSDGHATAGASSEAVLKNVEFRSGACYLNGAYEHGYRFGYRAQFPVGSLSYQSLGFCVDLFPLDFNPTPTGRIRPALWETLRSLIGANRTASYASHENVITAGPSYRWFSVKHRAGHLDLWLNNGNTQLAIPEAVMAPEMWHRLVISLDLAEHKILTSLDGRQLPTVRLPEPFTLNVIGSPDEATDKVLTFTDYSNGWVFHGYAAGLRVFDHALTLEEHDFLARDRAWEKRRVVGNARYSVLLVLVTLLVVAGPIGWRVIQGGRRP